MNKLYKLSLVLISTLTIYSGYRLMSTDLVASEKSLEIQQEKFSKYVDKKGNISLPEDFRMTMIHLGSWFVPEGGASGFHDVYTEASSAAYYRKTGKFPDGATLVKELRSAKTANHTTGANVANASQNIKQWFVMIKDTKGRFSNNSNWGDGWGWALIKTDNIIINKTIKWVTDDLEIMKFNTAISKLMEYINNSTTKAYIITKTMTFE